MRYAGSNNFLGHPAPGYHKPRCILTREAADKLKEAQATFIKRGYSLKVYDCYRPQKAVNAFYRWSTDPHDVRMQSSFYPNEPKNTLFAKGYIAEYSGHTRGSTIDLTVVPLSSNKPQGRFIACVAQPHDGSLNMGTPFDCFDNSAHVFYKGLRKEQLNNRLLLRNVMMQYDFIPYGKEWWHFTLTNEPYPHTYFNFPII